jgi:hypothetical protein
MSARDDVERLLAKASERYDATGQPLLDLLFEDAVSDDEDRIAVARIGMAAGAAKLYQGLRLTYGDDDLPASLLFEMLVDWQDALLDEQTRRRMEMN